MPTGYTADLKLDTPFPQFAMKCARAMGALVMMRDDPLDAPIPERFEPSDYDRQQLEAAHSRLAAAREMTDQQAVSEIEAFNSRQRQQRDEMIARDSAQRQAYERMIRLVESWTPPTDDHVNFKQFMLTQLRESLEWDCHEDMADRYYGAFTGTPAEWRDSEIASATERIAYHEKGWRDEQQRTESRNKWLAELRKSLA